MERQVVGIIGYGRFGQFFSKLLTDTHTILVADNNDLSTVAEANGHTFQTVEAVCKQADAIFICVPINQIEATVKDLKAHIQPDTIIFDTCSVKVHPAAVLRNNLGMIEGIDLVATHPMFGPDSVAKHGLEGLALAIWPLLSQSQKYITWRKYFESMGIRIVEMTPEEHDRLAADTQGLTHYIGRILGEMHLRPTRIDTTGYEIMRSLTEQTNNDSWELFQDLQTYNPFTMEMRLRLENSMDTVYSALIPKYDSSTPMKIGIQGGQGSFNEEACRHYCKTHGIDAFDISYLYTSVNVLDALHQGEVERGVFAIQNAAGGVVMETIHGLARYQCEILEVFSIVISHCVMHHPDISFDDVDTIISHPQAIAQCKANLTRLYPERNVVSGEGDLIDQAYCAEHISLGKLPKTTAVLAPRVCAELYGLQIEAEGLQDLGNDNLTTFVFVERRHYFR